MSTTADIDIDALLANPAMRNRLEAALVQPKQTTRARLMKEMKELAETHTMSLASFKKTAKDAWNQAYPSGIEPRKYKDGAWQLYVKVPNLTVRGARGGCAARRFG